MKKLIVEYIKRYIESNSMDQNMGYRDNMHHAIGHLQEDGICISYDAEVWVLNEEGDLEVRMIRDEPQIEILDVSVYNYIELT